MRINVKKILVFIFVFTLVFVTMDVFAEVANILPATFKKDKETLMNVLEKGQCGNICIRYERNISGMGYSAKAFGFCRVSITICKD